MFVSLSQLYCSITMEKTSSKANPPLDYVFLVQIIFICLSSIQNFFSRFWSFLQLQLGYGHSKVWIEKQQDFELSSQQFSFEKLDDGSLCREDVEMVMGKLGIFCSPESKELQEWLGSKELSRLFEEKEPSLEEAKEAFQVFDENRDGFIDVEELQRVVCILGLNEGLRPADCKEMIRKFDENGDGRIDFNEFVKLLENSFC